MEDKKIRKYIILILLALIALVFMELNKKEPTDWNQTYINTDKNPYGAFIIFDLLKEVFPIGDIRVSRLPISNELNYIDDGNSDLGSEQSQIEETSFKNTSYIFVNNAFGTTSALGMLNGAHSSVIDKLDRDNLLKFIEEGNSVFIAAENVSPLLLDTLKLKIKMVWNASDTTYVFTNISSKKYIFLDATGNKHYIEKGDSCKYATEILAESKMTKEPVFMRIKFGKGFLYLNTLPIAFSNVGLLDSNRYDFAFKSLSYLPKSSHVIWDEYQKQGRVGEDSSFRVIWSHQSLLYAYYLAIIIAVLFILFRSKRIQRVIPVLDPPKNTSLEFLDTLSNLYYQKEAYESIIAKRHGYFLDHVRTRYYLRTEVIDADFMDNLSRKSGVPVDIIKRIFDFYNEIIKSRNISNSLLLKYNEALEEFYREMK